MQEAVLAPLAPWESFYVIVGTAAATLTGLMFLVITVLVAVELRTSSPGDGIATFNTPSVVHFCVALLVAALLSVPWQALWHASLLLGISGLGGIIYVAVIVRRTRRQTIYQPVLEDWIWHITFPLIAYAAFVVTAIVLPIAPTPALFIVAAGTILLLFIGIHNAWDNITYTVIERYQQKKQGQD